MDKKTVNTEQNSRLSAAFQSINDEGREVLDTVIEKLAEIHWKPGEMEAKEHNGVGNNGNTKGEKP